METLQRGCSPSLGFGAGFMAQMGFVRSTHVPSSSSSPDFHPGSGISPLPCPA